MIIALICPTVWLLVCFTWVAPAIFQAMKNSDHFYDEIRLIEDSRRKYLGFDELNHGFMRKFNAIKVRLRAFGISVIVALLLFGLYTGLIFNQASLTMFIALMLCVTSLAILVHTLVTRSIKLGDGSKIRIMDGFEEGQEKAYFINSLKRNSAISCLALVGFIAIIIMASITSAVIFRA